MSDLLGISSSGIAAYQRALATVSNNIANVSTDGYTRQDVAIAAGQPRLLGGSYVGTGVRFDAVRRQYDAFIESNLRNSNSDLKAQEPLVSYVNRLIDIMGDQSIGLTTAMNLYFESARDLATDPASTVQRSTFLRDADGLAARFRQLSNQFTLLDNETRQSVETDVDQINSYTRQLALLNKQLAKHSDVNKQPSELLDQRDLLLRNLSSLTAIKTSFSGNGQVLVSLGDIISQGVLVDGTVSRDIGLSNATGNDASKLTFVLDPYGTPEALPNIVTGKVGGTINFRDQVLNPAVQSLNDLARVLADEVNKVHRNGVDAEGRLGEDLFKIVPNDRGAAAGIELALQDASRVAAAGQFRVIDNPLNTGNAQAGIRYATPSYSGPTGLYKELADARAPQIAFESVKLTKDQPVALGLVPMGMKDLVLTLQDPSAGQSLQVLTRDGRHLYGTSLTSAEQAFAMREGMEEGAEYKNALGGSSYLGMDIFVGAKAQVRQLMQFNKDTGLPIDPLPANAILEGAALPASLSGPIADKTFVLNGVSLGALNKNGTLTGNDLVTWINGYTPSTGVTASIVQNADGQDVLQLARDESNTTDDIRLGLGTAGTAADLSRLGFDQALYIEGEAADDLLVFATTTSATPTTITVSSQYTQASGDMKQALRAQDLEVVFTSDTTYKIVERGATSAATDDTVLAERSFDPSNPNATIAYRGLVLSFSAAPKEGDRYTINGNRDGIGNNEAMLEMVALEDADIMPGGLTMTEAYIERVNQVGSVARQAAISKQALTVVYEQAREARDGMSGVSLDEEASSLVRFQQAYQANAKAMQIAGSIFEAILNVR